VISSIHNQKRALLKIPDKIGKSLVQLFRSRHLDICEPMFLVALTLYEIASLVGITALSSTNDIVPKIITILRYTSFSLVTLKCLLMKRPCFNDGIQYCLVLMAGLICAEHSGDMKILDLAIMVVGANGVDYRKICKVTLIVSLATIALAALSSILGFVPNESVTMLSSSGEVRVRNAFGFISQNGLGAVCFTAFLSCYIGNLNSKKALTIIVAIVTCLVLIYVVDTRTAAYAIAILTFFWIANRFLKARTIVVLSALVCLMSLMFGLILPFIYDANSALMTSIDGWLSGRISCADWFIRNNGISLIGQEIDFLSTQEAASLGLTASVLDNAYIHLLVHFGVVGLLVVNLVYLRIFLSASSHGRPFICLVVATIYVVGMLETWFFMPYIVVAPFLLFSKMKIGN